MSTPMPRTDTIRLERYYACPPERIWAALTTPELLAQWWVPGDISPVVGYRFTLKMPKWGDIDCQVLEVDAPCRLVYTFGDWRLTWRLLQEGMGTRLYLEHSGFDLSNSVHRFAFDNMGPGWRDAVLPRLAGVVEAPFDAPHITA